MKFKLLCATGPIGGILDSSTPTECMWQRLFSKQTAFLVDTKLAQELKKTNRSILGNNVGRLFN